MQIFLLIITPGPEKWSVESGGTVLMYVYTADGNTNKF